MCDKMLLYKLELMHSLPVLDLRRTPSAYLLTRNSNIRLLRWLKRKYRHVSCLRRLGAVLTLVIIAAPRDVGVVLVIPAVVYSVTALCCTFATLSLGMVRIVMQQYEFWFFSGMNVANWSLLVYFLHDFRMLSLVAPHLAVELRILMDANFRTFVSHVKNCCLVEIPILLVIMVVVAAQLIDVRDGGRLTYVSIAKINLALVDLFLNTHMTVIVFTMHKAYNKRKLLDVRNAGCKSVQCMIFREKLILRRVEYGGDVQSTPSTSTTTGHHKRSGVLKQLGVSSPELFFAEPPCHSGRSPPAVGGNARARVLARTRGPSALHGVSQPRTARRPSRDVNEDMFTIACVCLADMMAWDYRCCASGAMGLWFHWILLQDAITPPVKQQLRFHKCYAIPVIIAVWVCIADAVYAVVAVDVLDSKLSLQSLIQWRLGHREFSLNTKSSFLSRIATTIASPNWTDENRKSKLFRSDLSRSRWLHARNGRQHTLVETSTTISTMHWRLRCERDGCVHEHVHERNGDVRDGNHEVVLHGHVQQLKKARGRHDAEPWRGHDTALERAHDRAEIGVNEDHTLGPKEATVETGDARVGIKDRERYPVDRVEDREEPELVLPHEDRNQVAAEHEPRARDRRHREHCRDWRQDAADGAVEEHDRELQDACQTVHHPETRILAAHDLESIAFSKLICGSGCVTPMTYIHFFASWSATVSVDSIVA
ncbi:hypothetical protein FI667_g15498, partial [Globisporangium splendens]